MKPRDSEDKPRTRWAGGAKKNCNKQKLVSQTRESEAVAQGSGMSIKLSPTLSGSRYSCKQRDKTISQKNINKPFHPHGLESTISPGIARKLATGKDREGTQEKKSVKLKSRWSGSKSDMSGREYFTVPLNVGDVGSEPELEFKQTKHLNSALQKEDNVNDQATITPPSSSKSTLTSVRSDLNLFNFRKFIKDLIEDQYWLVEKIDQLKEELKTIEKKMNEVIEQSLQKRTTSNAEIMNLAHCRYGAREGVCRSNNCLQGFRLSLFDNKSCGLSTPTMNISDSSSSVDSPEFSSGDIFVDCDRKLTAITENTSGQQEINGARSLQRHIWRTRQSKTELCSSTNQPVSGVFHLLQYFFLIALVIAQCLVQFVIISA